MEAKQKLINVPLSRKRSVPNPDSKSEETKQAGSSTWWLPLYLVFVAARPAMEIILLDQMFFQQSGPPTPQQVVEKSCSQYHRSSSIGCKTRRREKRRRSSLIRSKILDSKPSFSPKAPSSLTSNGLQRDSLASFVEFSLD